MPRDYQPADLPAVLTIFRRAVHEVACRDYSPEQLAAWAPPDIDQAAWAKRLAEGGVFVEERDGQLTGFIRIDDKGHIDLMFVHPDYQRQGVARRLFESARDWAIQAGLTRLTSDVSLTARRFFESLGFQVLALQTVERGGF
jgi:putative acetyltransferase